MTASPLAGKLAVITGASSGIGSAVAIALATERASLFLMGRRLTALEELARKARTCGSRVEVFPADLTVDADIERLKETLQKSSSTVDYLIHSAGVFDLGRVESAPVQRMDDQFRCNVRAPFLLTQALLPLLKQGRGQVVFMNSTVGLEARANVAQYAASKHALRAIADSLREEVNAAGVRVLSLYLGRTATPMQEAVFRGEGKPYAPQNLLQPEDVASLLLGVLRLPHNAEVTEIRVRPAVKSY
jgi:short-subunit dehydrogenase